MEEHVMYEGGPIPRKPKRYLVKYERHYPELSGVPPMPCEREYSWRWSALWAAEGLRMDGCTVRVIDRGIFRQ